MTKLTTGLLVAAVIAAFAVGAALAAGKSEVGPQPQDGAGMMPEIVCSAEAPRLVMPVMEVRAFQAVAMNASDYNAN